MAGFKVHVEQQTVHTDAHSPWWEVDGQEGDNISVDEASCMNCDNSLWDTHGGVEVFAELDPDPESGPEAPVQIGYLCNWCLANGFTPLQMSKEYLEREAEMMAADEDYDDRGWGDDDYDPAYEAYSEWQHANYTMADWAMENGDDPMSIARRNGGY